MPLKRGLHLADARLANDVVSHGFTKNIANRITATGQVA